MKTKIILRSIILSIAALSFVHSCSNDEQVEGIKDSKINKTLIQESAKVETVTINGKSLLKITTGKEVEFADSYLLKDRNIILKNINNIITFNNGDITSKSGYQVIIDDEAYLGDGYMMEACKGYPIDMELVDVNGELWLKFGATMVRGGSIYLNGLNPYEIEYFQCMAMYDPMGIIQINVVP